MTQRQYAHSLHTKHLLSFPQTMTIKTEWQLMGLDSQKFYQALLNMGGGEESIKLMNCWIIGHFLQI